jgi:GTPase
MVQDAASPMREEQKAQVEEVLAQLAVSTKPVIQVLNKVDRVPSRELAQLSSDREAILVSSLQHTALEQLLNAIDGSARGGPAR